MFTTLAMAAMFPFQCVAFCVGAFLGAMSVAYDHGYKTMRHNFK